MILGIISLRKKKMKQDRGLEGDGGTILGRVFRESLSLDGLKVNSQGSGPRISRPAFFFSLCIFMN